MNFRPAYLAVASVILATLVMLHTLFYSEGWGQRERVRTDLEAIVAENDHMAADIEDVRQQIDALRKRPEVQEHSVRQELGYVRDGDIVLDLNPKNP